MDELGAGAGEVEAEHQHRDEVEEDRGQGPDHPSTPPDREPAHVAICEGSRCSCEAIVVGSRLVLNRWLTQSITEVVRSGTPFTKSVTWLKNSCPKTTASAEGQERRRFRPRWRSTTPLDRPRWTSHRMPGSRAVANNHASTSRNRKWLSTENSHRNSSSPTPSAREDQPGPPDRPAVEVHVDVQAAAPVAGTTTGGAVSERDAWSASGVGIVITRPRGPETAACPDVRSLSDRVAAHARSVSDVGCRGLAGSRTRGDTGRTVRCP